MAYDTTWLVDKFGIPGEVQPIKFHVEYMSKGKYIGARMTANTLSEVIENIFREAKNDIVGRMTIKSAVPNETYNFQLINSDRL
jgi:hypothetical protein